MTSGRVTEAEIRLALGREPNARLFRNAVGEAWQGKVVSQAAGTITLEAPRRVVYGLHPGSADLIAIQRVTVTPNMIGQTIGVFCSVEVKSGTGRAREDQRRWAAFVREFGGRAGVAYTPDQARAILAGQVAE